MHGHIPENDWPINQRARELLEQVGSLPNPHTLYVLQLIDWGIEEDPSVKETPLRRPMDNFQEVLHQMYGDEPEWVMGLLEPVIDTDEIATASPEEAAWRLLDALESGLYQAADEAATREKTLDEIIEECAAQGITGIDEALAGLYKLFGGAKKHVYARDEGSLNLDCYKSLPKGTRIVKVTLPPKEKE